MRKFTFLLFAILFGHFTYSQIVVTNADVVSKGSVIVQSNDQNPDPSVQPGDAGADMMWDFSALVSSEIDTMKLVDPSQTPFADDFPTANLAMDISDSGYAYVERSNERMLLVGLAVEIDTLGNIRADIEPGQSMVEFPLEYGATYSGSSTTVFTFDYNQPGVDSIRVKQIMEQSREVDAWGQMTIPMGTYNVLREHQTATITDSIFVKTTLGGWMFVSSTETQTESYSWWSTDAGTGFVIATLSMDESREVQNATFMESEVTQGIHAFDVEDTGVEVFPNPVENQLNFEFDKTFDGTVNIIDLTGRIIANQKVNGQHVSFNLADQTEGVYFYRITKEGATSVITGKLIKR